MADPRDGELKPVSSVKTTTSSGGGTGGTGGAGPAGTSPPGGSPPPGTGTPAKNPDGPTPAVSPTHPDQVHGLTPPPSPTVSPTHPDQVHGLTPPAGGDPLSPEDGVDLTPDGEALAAVQNFNVHGDPEEVQKLQDGLVVLSNLENQDAQDMLAAFEERGTVITFGNTFGADALYKPISLNPLNAGSDIIIVNENFRDQPPEVIAGAIAFEGVHALQNEGGLGDRVGEQGEFLLGIAQDTVTGESRVITDHEADMLIRGVPILQEIRDSTGVEYPHLPQMEAVTSRGPDFVEEFIHGRYPTLPRLIVESVGQTIVNTDPGEFPEINSAP